MFLAPVGVTAPYEARHLSGFKVEVKWLAPVSTAGLMSKFVLKAYNNEDPLIDPVEALFTNTSKRKGVFLFSFFSVIFAYFNLSHMNDSEYCLPHGNHLQNDIKHLFSLKMK